MSQTQAAFAYFNRAANLYRQGCYAQAIQCYLAGLEIDPMCVEAYADLAKAYEKLGYWDQAIESLESALRLHPGYPTALRRKQRILEEKSVYDGLTDELNLAPDSADQSQPVNTVQSNIPKIEHELFTLTGGRTIPQNLLLVVSQIVEHTYHEVGAVFQCYPHYKVPVFIEVANQLALHFPIDQDRLERDQNGTDLSGVETSQAAGPVSSATSPIEVTSHTLFSDASLPQWAVACYDNGSIRLTYQPYSDSSIGVLYAVVRHEWTHLLVDLLTEGRCPKWLDEGLAQFMSRPLMNSEKTRLQQAIRDRHFLPFHSLKKPFQHLPEQQRRLAYLQSYAITKYLIQRFSFAALRDVLKHLGDRKSTHTAFQEVFGKSEEEIIVASSAENCMIV